MRRDLGYFDGLSLRVGHTIEFFHDAKNQDLTGKVLWVGKKTLLVKDDSDGTLTTLDRESIYWRYIL